jgi:hypothetical protein
VSYYNDERHWCVRCFALESEPAGEGCGNPAWHAAVREIRLEERTEDGPFQDDD